MAAHHQLTFPVARTAAAVQQARHRVVAAVCSWDIRFGEEELDGIELVAGELVANAVLHATSGPVTVGVHRKDAALVVEVHDTAKTLTETDPVDVNAESGRGLHLVSALADRHGVDLTANGKRCWAEFVLRSEPGNQTADQGSDQGLRLLSGFVGERGSNFPAERKRHVHYLWASTRPVFAGTSTRTP
jgi:anti-sigma regulatory factor (Ser/Thr protein kinase)